MFFKSPVGLWAICFFAGILLVSSSCMTSLLTKTKHVSIFPNLDFSNQNDVFYSPISLFQTKYTEDIIEIKIQTLNENCLAGLELERAVNTNSFEKIGREEVFGDSIGADYLLVDYEVFWNDTVKYRLKILNRDGTYEYTKETKVLVEKAIEKVSLISNPLQSKRYLEVAALTKGFGEMEVFNAKGEQIFSKRIHLKAGKNWSVIELENVENGVYLVDLKVGNKHWTKKLIKFS